MMPLAATLLALVAVAPRPVLSDGEWRVSAREEAGWTAPAFDDARWARVSGPHPDAWSGGAPIAWAPDPAALPIWSGPGQPEAFLRRSFEIAGARPETASAFIEADDDYELYVNGTLAGASRDGALTVPGDVYDVSALLRPGRNVLAIRGIDTGFGEHVLFALHFGGATPPPVVAPAPSAADVVEAVPASRAPSGPLLVLLAALLAVGVVAWRIPRFPGSHAAVLASLVGIAWLYQASVLRSLRGQDDLAHLLARWSLSLGAAALAFGAWDRWTGRSLRAPLTRRQGLGVLALSAASLALYAWDLGSWRFSFLGDEFSFFTVARDLARGSLVWADIFSEEGVYGYHPRLASFYQAAVMRVFGIDNFGWRLSSALAAAAGLLPCFILLKHAVSARAAWAGTFLLAVSHYSMAFAHVGYDNNHVLFPVLACLALLFWSERVEATLGDFAAGVAAGLGFYTFYTSRLAVAFGLAYFLLLWLRRRPWRAVVARAACFAVGFGLAAGPALARPAQFLENMRQQSGEPLAARTLRNAVLALESPWSFEASSHFVSGSLVDGVSAVLWMIGAWTALGRFRRSGAYPLLLGLYVVSAIVIGASAPYESPPATRMLFLVVPTLLLAALGAEVAWGHAESRLGRRAGEALALVVAVSVAGLNLHRLYVETPRHNGVPTQSLVLKYLQEAPAAGRYYYVLPDDWGAELIELHLEMYGMSGKTRVLHFADVRARPEALEAPATVVFNDAAPEARAAFAAWLRTRQPGATERRLAGPGEQSAMFAMTLP